MPFPEWAPGVLGAGLTAFASALALIAVTAGGAGAATRPAARPALLAAAGWHGRPVRDPKPASVAVRIQRWPAGWSARAIRLGAGYHSPGGSARVRATQRMLRRLGYRPGPVDGRLGPRTASAIAWFQVKHALRRTGGVDLRTLALLRARTRGTARDTTDQPATLAADERRAGPPTPVRITQKPSHPAAVKPAETDLTVPVIVVALAGLLSTMILALSRRGGPGDRQPAPPPALPVVGYTTGAAADVADALDALCRERGWTLTRVICDPVPASRRLRDRPGLFEALEMIASRRAGGLVVPRLRDLTASASDLGPLMRWIEDSHTRVVVLDVELDTTTDKGRAVVRALSEVGGWETSAPPERPSGTFPPSRPAARGTGRPSVRDDPELIAWIGQMRSDGMSLQAIADALNENGVPTLRGGERWRPSSVQSAVGYKRPPADTRVTNGPGVER